MNILHVLEDYSLHSGGLRTVVKELNEHLNDYEDVNSYIVSSKKEEEDDVCVVSSSQDKPWLYSKDWKHILEKFIIEKNIELIHIHGVWMFPQHIAAKLAVKNKIPFILTPHGMYEPWLWTKGTLKKKLYFHILSKNLFSKAFRIHAITKDEKNNLKKLFSKSEFVEIPNLIKNKDIHLQNLEVNNEKYILYLGRLHEKKGIDILIKSFSNLEDKNIKLKIAGGLNEYKSKLDALVGQLKLEKRIEFLGLVKGQQKNGLFRNAYVFVAPSFSEVVGMVNLEAALQQTPVITTHQTGLKKEWNENGGVLINPNQDEIIFALEKAINWSLEERNSNGNKLFQFVKKNYSWEYRFIDWLKLYKSTLNYKNNYS
jgi:glycosyltransferase involved in cell wall biosynthesis